MMKIPAVSKQGDLRAICRRLREFGYAKQRQIKLYGEEFQLVSDPIVDGDGFAIEAIPRSSGNSRYIGIPLSIVQTLRRELSLETPLDSAA